MNAPPSWFDWITAAAIVLGPILALLAQRGLDHIREKRRRRLLLYMTLMSTRATGVAPDHVNALNSIDVVFSDKSDQEVRDAWHKVLAHLGTDPNAAGWQEKLNDLKVDLFREIGVRVGYDFTTDYLKRQIYLPTYYVNAESELLQIRHALTEALTDDGLKVKLAVPQEPPAVRQEK